MLPDLLAAAFLAGAFLAVFLAAAFLAAGALTESVAPAGASGVTSMDLSSSSNVLSLPPGERVSAVPDVSDAVDGGAAGGAKPSYGGDTLRGCVSKCASGHLPRSLGLTRCRCHRLRQAASRSGDDLHLLCRAPGAGPWCFGENVVGSCPEARTSAEYRTGDEISSYRRTPSGSPISPDLSSYGP